MIRYYYFLIRPLHSPKNCDLERVRGVPRCAIPDDPTARVGGTLHIILTLFQARTAGSLGFIRVCDALVGLLGFIRVYEGLVLGLIRVYLGLEGFTRVH